ncbi:MAG: DUF4411 family protein [Pirellulales bacterium]
MTKYCLDTGVLVNGWQKHYQPIFAPKFWTFLSDMLTSGRAIVPREVYEEIEQQDDSLLAWIRQRREFVRETTEDVVLALKAIMQDTYYGRIVKLKGTGRSGADPWLIAHAQIWGATVVCEEGSGGKNDPKIPDVCLGLGVGCISTRDMLVAEQFSF